MATSEHKSMSGTLLLQHPFRNQEEYVDGDKLFRMRCCPDSEEVRGVNFEDFCSQFFERRPIAMSANAPAYSAPVVGKFYKIIIHLSII